jgi:hypothetical protein
MLRALLLALFLGTLLGCQEEKPEVPPAVVEKKEVKEEPTLALKFDYSFTPAVSTPIAAATTLVVTPLPPLSLKPPLSAAEQKMVAKAEPYMPSLKVKIDKYWPTMDYPPTLGALIEKESLWNPKAVLCVPKPNCDREYGFGFGQLTITKRFNVFEEVKLLHPDLKDWKYEDRFDPERQMSSLTLKVKLHHKQCTALMTPGVETYACAFSSYNGGYGGVVADRRLCANTEGCDPRKWFGNVSEHSMKAKEPQPGYGQSFYQINRGYVRAVIYERPRKYAIFPGFENLP